MNLLPFVPVLVLLLTTVVLVVALWRKRFPSKTEWLVSALMAVGFTLYAVMVAPWDFVSYYLRPLLAAAGVAAFLVSLVRVRHAPWWRAPESKRAWLSLATSGVIGLLFCGLSVVVLASATVSGSRSVELSFPLTDGVAYVGQGGGSTAVNYHHPSRAQAYALDIVALNAAGLRGRGVLPTDPEQYAVFGRAVHSPCSGTVVEARDGLVDQSPPTTDTVNLVGNHVVVRCAGTEPAVDVLLAHLRQGSVAVETGTEVRSGDLVGRVGNTGNTSEPHLHVHAVLTGSGSVLKGEGVPIRFDGRFLVRNSLVFGS